MVRSRLGLKVLGLCALALGLMAFVASAAQAEAGAVWKVNGTSITSGEANKLEIEKLEGETATLLFTTAGGTKVAILCTSASFDEGGNLLAGGAIKLGRVLFKGCVTSLNGVLSAGCKPKTTGKASGEILTLKATGEILLDEVAGVKESYAKLTPDETNFADLEMGEECAIGELVPVSGQLWIKDCKGSTSFRTEAATHLIEESLHLLKALGQPATIDGSAIVKLAGGGNWAGIPN